MVLGLRILGYRVVKKELERWSMVKPDKELLLKYRKMCRDMGIHHLSGICLNQKLTTPLLSGLFRPQIYLPSEQFTQRNMELLSTKPVETEKPEKMVTPESTAGEKKSCIWI